MSFEEMMARKAALDFEIQRTEAALEEPGEETPAEPDPPKEPVIPEEAFRGLAGDIVSMLSPHTEADPVALLVSILSEFGCIVGRRPHLSIDATYHPLLFWPVIVGASSKSRKGSSGKRIRALFRAAAPTWSRGANSGQLSSGEGLVWAVRDEVWKKNKKGEDILDDEGVQDKRLFLTQTEFGGMLRIMAREGNSLSGFLRCAWDGDDLIPMTSGRARQNIRSTKPHISIVGHVTKDEVLRNLTETEASNGFGNRFAWFYVKRSKELPFPGKPEASEENRLVIRLQGVISHANGVNEIFLSAAARDLWIGVYSDLSKDRPGLSGSLLNRSEAYALRLSAIYALLDGKGEIDAPHLLAALALWKYAVASAYFIFGNKTGDPVADAIFEGIQLRGEMSDTEISAIFNRNQPAARLSQAKTTLKETGLVMSETRDTEGRRVTVWKLS